LTFESVPILGGKINHKGMLGPNLHCGSIIFLLHFSVCEAGKFSAAGSATCSECEAGEFSAAGSVTCSECEAGKYSAAGSDSCSTCGMGKDANSNKTDCGENWDLNCYLIFVTYL